MKRPLRPGPTVPYLGSAGEKPIPKGGQGPYVEHVEVDTGSFTNSCLYDGGRWPIVSPQTFDIPSGEKTTYRVSRGVPFKLGIQVLNSGTLDIYVRGMVPNPGTDLPHWRVIGHPIPYVIHLPPGDHEFVFYAKGGQVQCSVNPYEIEGRE